MTKKVKIIQLSSTGFYKNEYHPKKDEDLYYVASWGGLLARRLIKRYPDLDIEVWRVEKEFKNITKKKVFNVVTKIFPYKKVLFKRIITTDMLKLLLQYQKKYHLILHIHEVHNVFTYFAPFLLRKTKIIIQNRGKRPPQKNNFKEIVKRLIEKLSYSKVDAIIYNNPRPKKYFEKILKKPPLHFLPTGVDFDKFSPLNQEDCRHSLGLEKDKIYALYVGYFYKLKNVDFILDVYYKLKEKYNFSVIFVGGVDDDHNDLYHEVVNSGCKYFNQQPWEKMIHFYNSCNFFVNPVFNKNFNGFDNAISEALACNKPVISPLLSALDFNYQDLGINLTSPEKILENTEWMINNYDKFTNCRSIAINHLNGNTVILDKFVDVYNNLSN